MGEYDFPLNREYSGCVESNLACPYDGLISKVKEKRGNRPTTFFAQKLHVRWKMELSGALQSIGTQLENASAWERLSIRDNGKRPDKIEPTKSTLQVRCKHMQDYLRALGYSKADQGSFFQELRSIDTFFTQYTPK